MASLRDRLPPDLLALQDTVSHHDATLVSLTGSLEDRSAILKLRPPGVGQVELRYSGLTSFASTATPGQSLRGAGGYGDLGYDEVDVLEDGTFEHRILFSTSIEFRFCLASIAALFANALRALGKRPPVSSRRQMRYITVRDFTPFAE